MDILYKTTFKEKEGYIWILLEHQRKSDPWMPVRVFKYIGIIWDHLRKSTKSKTIPFIYPMIIYNGDRPYHHSLNLSDLIIPAESKHAFANLFNQPFCLIDLATIPDETLKQAAQKKIKGVALLMALKHVFDKNLQSFFEETLMNLLKQLDSRGDTDEVVDVIYYLLNQGEFRDEGRFWATFHHHFSKEVENKMTTIAQKIEARGREKGRKEGREEGVMNTAKQLLNEKTSLSENELIQLVQRLTGLSIEKVKELKNKH